MFTNSNHRACVDTSIMTPMEKMRANAIIRAKHDKAGLSVINFNITHFIPKIYNDSAYFVLSEWAIEPIKSQPNKFAHYPIEGEKALIKRIEILIENLSSRHDIPTEFIQNAKMQMIGAVSRKIHATQTANTQNNEILKQA